MSENERDERGIAHEGVPLREAEDVLGAAVRGELDGVRVLPRGAQDEAEDGVEAVGVRDGPRDQLDARLDHRGLLRRLQAIHHLCGQRRRWTGVWRVCAGYLCARRLTCCLCIRATFAGAKEYDEMRDLLLMSVKILFRC